MAACSSVNDRSIRYAGHKDLNDFPRRKPAANVKGKDSRLKR